MPHAPMMFVLVDVSHWQTQAQAPSHDGVADRSAALSGNATLVMGDGMQSACVLLRPNDLDSIDAQLDAWITATAARLIDVRTRYAALTPRERQALPLVTDGLLNKQAAAAMGISEATLQIHRKRVMAKMGARSFADLVRIADLLGLSRHACQAPMARPGHNKVPSPRPHRLGAHAA